MGVRSLTVPLTALLVFASAGFAQQAKPAPAAPEATPPAQPAAASPSADESVVKMSPFEVSTDKNAGYYTANTLAGTRLRNNIGDLPSSITVVTQQQLQDTNSRNINDVFRYEANTEGASTYTPIAIVRSNLADTLGGNGGTTGNFTGAVATGNRVRGLSTVDNEQDNFFSLYRIPFDSYNTQSIEVLRGPNSIIFGTGSPAGIVNQQRIQADTEKRSGNLNLSVSSYGGYRESFGANVPLISGRLGLYVAQLYDTEGFKQKPSSDVTRRQYVAMTFYPFKSQKTKLSASFENYNNYANDPNGVTPVDFVTPWLQSGRPVWNTVTDVVTYLDGGRTVGPYAVSNAYPNYTAPITQALLTTTTSPYFVPSLTFLAANHRTMFISQGNVEYTFNAGEGPGSGLNVAGWIPAVTAMTNADKLLSEERLTLTAGLPAPRNSAGAFIYATWANTGVTSKSVYDWSNISINSLASTWTKAKTYNIKLEQQILKNLYVQLAWFRQDLRQLQDAPLSQANATTMYVDTNQYLLTGQANAHVGQPFIDVYAVDVYNQPESNNNLQAMVSYEPDFRGKVPGWLEWLGHHRFLAVFQNHDDVSTALRWRPAIVGGDPNYLPTAAAMAVATGYSFAASNTAIEEWFYMGTPAGANLTGKGLSSPGFFRRAGYGGPTAANIQTYNYTTHSWNTTEMDMAPVLFNSGGLSENLQRSATFFWQGYFWNDRLIGMFGVNQDKVKNRSTLFPSVNPLATLYTNGLANEQYWRVYGPWTPVVGTTHMAGIVAHPFTNWKGMDAAAERGSILPAFLRTLSVTVNRSGNFNPPPAHYTDFFGNDLGKPQGKEKDWGLEIATPDNKLFLRATWFHTTNENALVTLTSTARAQYIDQTELKAWATKVVQVRTWQTTGYGVAPDQLNFGNVSIYPITQAMQDQIAALTHLPYNYGNNVGENGQFVAANANQNGDAKGFELELTYNPLRNWTMKFSVAQQKTTVTGAAAQAQAWIDHRFPTWQTYVAADLTGDGRAGAPANSYTLNNGTHMYLANFWQGFGYDSNVTEGNINGWTTTQNYYNTVVAGQLAID